jgi:adapter protein MecA 1/2
MKIEKINENQIRCTLSKEDLETRNIKLSELAYGTGKTKELFQDMMRQANDDFGFEVNDIPLMVEAIPVSPESIILVITKVEDPEETENHLSKFFSKSKEFQDELRSHIEDSGLSLRDFEEIEVDDDDNDKVSSDVNLEDSLLYSIYVFNTLSEVITVAKLLAPVYKGDSSVYKSPFDNRYYLSLCMEIEEEKHLNKICSVLTELGTRETPTYAKELFYMEHYEEIIANKAIEKLGQL